MFKFYKKNRRPSIYIAIALIGFFLTVEYSNCSNVKFANMSSMGVRTEMISSASFTTKKPFKLLIILDNSNTMGAMQSQLAAGFGPFFDKLAGFDVEINMTSTSFWPSANTSYPRGMFLYGGCSGASCDGVSAGEAYNQYSVYHGLSYTLNLTSTMAPSDFATKKTEFMSTIQSWGTNGSDKESAVLPLATLLANRTYTSADSLAVLMVSDEDDNWVKSDPTAFTRSGYFDNLQMTSDANYAVQNVPTVSSVITYKKVVYINGTNSYQIYNDGIPTGQWTTSYYIGPSAYVNASSSSDLINAPFGACSSALYTTYCSGFNSGCSCNIQQYTDYPQYDACANLTPGDPWILSCTTTPGPTVPRLVPVGTEVKTELSDLYPALRGASVYGYLDSVLAPMVANGQAMVSSLSMIQGGPCQLATGESYDQTYAPLAAKYNGTSQNLCDADYSPTLQRITQFQNTTVNSTYTVTTLNASSEVVSGVIVQTASGQSLQLKPNIDFSSSGQTLYLKAYHPRSGDVFVVQIKKK